MFDLKNLKSHSVQPGDAQTSTDHGRTASTTRRRVITGAVPVAGAARVCVGWLVGSASVGVWADSGAVHATVTSDDIAVNLLIFILASFLGLGLIHGVAKLLHTPLMALTNAISSVSVVAALIVLSYPDNSPLVIILATVGTALALSNVVSGFMITERILKMFRKGNR